jgi:hypothetical protein
MRYYFDMHYHEIHAGDLIHCALNGDVERVHGRDDELGILGSPIDGERSFMPLTTFGHKRTSEGALRMEYFEIIR